MSFRFFYIFLFKYLIFLNIFIGEKLSLDIVNCLHIVKNWKTFVNNFICYQNINLFTTIQKIENVQRHNDKHLQKF